MRRRRRRASSSEAGVSEDDPRVNRRRFFREGLRQLLGKVEQAAEPVARFAKEFEKLEQMGSPPAASTPPSSPARPVTLPLVLRPPGALNEPDFLSTCSRCAKCVDACPVSCIVLDPTAAGGAPHIVAERKACIVCDELSCMNVCPTGALQLLPRVLINMGRAVWGEGKCLRSDGQDCRICVDACPMGTAALAIEEDGRVEVREACTGCGTCQHVCPTTPRAIVIVPRR